MTEDRIWLLMAKRLAGEASEEDENELEKLIEKDPGITYKLEMVLNYWNNTKNSIKDPDIEALSKLKKRIIISEACKNKRPNRKDKDVNMTFMLKSYFIAAWRQLARNKSYSSLNIFGLALGIACAMLIFLWMGDEFQYDRHYENYSRLYRVMENQRYEGKIYTFAAMPGKFAAAIKEELPEVKYSTSASWGGRELFIFDDRSIYETGFFADPDFLKIFSSKVLKGDTTAVLNDPSSVIISERMAKRFFGNDEPLGKLLRLNNDLPLTVKAIIEEPPLSGTLQFSWLASFKIFERNNTWIENWSTNGVQTFVELNEGADPVKLNAKLREFITKKDANAVAKPFLLPAKDWRLRSNFEGGKQTGGRITTVRLFSIIAMLIVIIACINFMNLATARSGQRSREVGVRKVIGAGRGKLVRQFFAESLVLSFVAMILAALIVWLVLPFFNTLVEKRLSFDLSNPFIFGGLGSMALLCALLAGSYPALYLSSFNPVTVFKGLHIGKNNTAVYVRKGLVMTQFIVSIVLIISTIIIYQQIQHVKSRNLGYDKGNIISTAVYDNTRQHFPAIYNDLLATGVVQNAATSNNSVLYAGGVTGDFNWKGKAHNAKLLVNEDWVSPQFIPTMGMKLKSGRNFYDGIVSDSSSVIINQAFARIISEDDPIGHVLIRDNGHLHTIVGVVEDYIFNNMYDKPEPILLYCNTGYGYQLHIRLKAGHDVQTAIAKIESVMKHHNPAYPFEYRFLDDAFNARFKTETLTGNLAGVFTFLAILISCLGLFGLVAYTAERRTKEIGVRKVLGASVGNVVGLLSKDFLSLVIIASVIAFPLAWWIMRGFLYNFAYRINIQWWVFVVAGLMAVFIAFVTISFQAIKAAMANPVKSLRTE